LYTTGVLYILGKENIELILTTNKMSMNLIDRIKETFHKFNIEPSSVGVKLEEESQITLASEGKLQDGTMIYSTADSWAVGSDCYTMDESGNPVPMSAGEYVLEDGSKMVVDDKGFITEIASVEEEQMSSEDFIESLSEKVNALTNEKTELASQLANESEKSIKANKELASVKTELSALKKTASTTSIKEAKSHAFGKEKSAPVQKTYAQMTLKERILFNIENNKSN
jgi:ribosomal protein L29